MDALFRHPLCTNFYMVKTIISAWKWYNYLIFKFIGFLTFFDCVSKALGFYHMHQVYNRDEFIDIHWENVEVGKEIQFRKYTNPELTLSNSTYDYFSIMHYGAYYFSKNGRPTIVPKVSIMNLNYIPP